MNSKLRNILQSWLDNAMTTSSFGWSPIDGYKGHEGNSEKEAAKDYEKYLAKAEKAIRQAVGEEMLGLKPNNPYKTTDGQVPESFEAPAHAYDVANSDWESKIKEWQG